MEDKSRRDNGLSQATLNDKTVPFAGGYIIVVGQSSKRPPLRYPKQLTSKGLQKPDRTRVGRNSHLNPMAGAHEYPADYLAFTAPVAVTLHSRHGISEDGLREKIT